MSIGKSDIPIPKAMGDRSDSVPPATLTDEDMKGEDHSDVLNANINEPKVQALKEYYEYSLRKQRINGIVAMVSTIIAQLTTWVYIFTMQTR